jgi:ribosomal protein S3AE
MAKKLKGKEWYVLIAPRFFNNKKIGETPVGDPKTLMGRKIDIHLINLIDDLSKYYIKFYFKVNEIKDNKAYTEFAGLECLRDYISRMIRYGIKRIDTVQDLITSDEIKLRVKTVTITSKKMKKNVEIELKKFVEEKMKKNVESNKLDDFIEKTIYDNFKRSLIKEGSKIYPIRTFEIRRVERLP